MCVMTEGPTYRVSVTPCLKQATPPPEKNIKNSLKILLEVFNKHTDLFRLPPSFVTRCHFPICSAPSKIDLTILSNRKCAATSGMLPQLLEHKQCSPTRRIYKITHNMSPAIVRNDTSMDFLLSFHPHLWQVTEQRGQISRGLCSLQSENTMNVSIPFYPHEMQLLFLTSYKYENCRGRARSSFNRRCHAIFFWLKKEIYQDL